MDVTVAHTPDADDAFMFYGMLSGRIPSRGFRVSHSVAGIDDLNRAAGGGAAPDVTAASVYACASMPGHTVLRSGGSFGIGYGPVLVAREEMGAEEAVSSTVAVPGTTTSAFLLLRMMAGEFECEVMPFAEIPGAVRDGRAAAGLIIHEAQLSYGAEGCVKVADLGEWWHGKTGGLPVPLGVNAMRTDLGEDAIRRFDAHLHDSIRFGMDNREEALEYAMRYARGRPRDLIDRFVGMYVNGVTLDMGSRGAEAVDAMFEMAASMGVMERFRPRVAPPLGGAG